MSELLRRATPVDLEVRGGDGRTIVGIAVPFDTPTQVNDGRGSNYIEVFRHGAFHKTIQERMSKVKVLANHDRRRLPIGRTHLLREDTAGLYSELKVSATRDGDEVLQLVRDGALDGLSVGFAPVKDNKPDRSTVERVEVRLHEISVVGFPAYEGAAIAAVRADGTPYRTRPNRDVLRARLDLLERAIP